MGSFLKTSIALKTPQVNQLVLLERPYNFIFQEQPKPVTATFYKTHDFARGIHFYPKLVSGKFPVFSLNIQNIQKTQHVFNVIRSIFCNACSCSSRKQGQKWQQ
jgi:hypothetical protein